MQHVDVVVERVTRRDRDRVPEVVRVVPLVVVAHTGVHVDDGRGGVDTVGVDLRGHERRVVSEGTGVEDRRQLAEHVEVLEAADPVAQLGLGDAQPIGQHRVGRLGQREVPLDRVQQLAVEVLQLVDVLRHETAILA